MLNFQKAKGIQLVFILKCWLIALTSLNVDDTATYRCDSWKETSKIFSICDEIDLCFAFLQDVLRTYKEPEDLNIDKRNI